MSHGDNGYHGPLTPMMDSEAHSFSLMEYAEILWRRRVLLLVIIVLGTGSVFAVVRNQKPVYRATASVLFRNSPEIITLGQPDTHQDGSSPEISFQTQVELFQSKALIKKVLAKLNDGVGVDAANANASARSRELWFVAKSLTVTPIKGTRLIQIQAESHDPRLAASFPNKIVSSYIEQEHEGAWKRSQSDREWLNAQVATLRQSIEAAEKSLFSYASANGLAFTSEKDKGLDGRLLRLQDELSKAQVERFSAESRYEMAMKTSADSVADVFDSGAVRDYQGKLTELRRQLAEANSLWTGDHYKVKQLEAQLAVLKSASDNERQNVISRAKNDYTSAVRREQLLATEYVSAVRTVTDQANRSIHYNLLKRDLDRDRELYDGIVQRVKQVGITSGMRPTAIHLIDTAEPPQQPQRPNIPLESYLGLICSVFVGVVAVLIKENLSSTLENPGDSTLYLHANELGTIPSQYHLHSWRRVIGSNPLNWPMAIKARSLMRSAQKSVGSVELATWNRADSLTAQCFRATLASILFSSQTRTADQIHTIVVTSAVGGEGKTTVVSNLGLALARMSRKVLLIDADYQKPRLHKVFGLPAASGLREIIESSDGISIHAAAETDIPGLYLLQSGAGMDEFPEILQSSRIAELVEAAKGDFDFVLIDTPPVLHLPDARIWGRLADGVVLVVRAGATNRQRAWSAVYSLAKDGVPFLGTVLNDWDPKSSPAYEYANPSAGVRQL